MGTLTKKQKTLVGKVDSTKLYPLDNALALVKEHATAKFDESIDVAVQLGIDAKAGQVQFRVDKAGIVHATIGRRSFESDKLAGNLRALIEALNKAKPASSKGIYLRKVALSSTMGVGARVDVASINAAALQA